MKRAVKFYILNLSGNVFQNVPNGLKNSLKSWKNKNLFKMNTNFAFGIYKKCS